MGETELQAEQVLGDLSPAEFTAEGHALIDWIARYLSEVEDYPVMSQVRPGAVRMALPTTPPTTGAPFAELMEEFERSVLPGVTHWNHPGFFAYFAISGSGPGILAELLTAALNINGMLWRTSPAATELEEVVLEWLRQMLGLPPGLFGIICDTASISSMLALAAAREAQPDLMVRERGLAGRDLPILRVYTSVQSHSSIDKGAITLGFGHENVVHVEVDSDWRMRPDALAAAIARDRLRHCRPVAVVATVGTTGTSSIDPVPAIADILRARGSLAARGRLVRRHRRDRARVPRHPRRCRARRFTGGEPAQVALHAGGLLGAVHSPARGAPTCVLADSRIPPDDGAKRRRELHGLRHAARPTVPGAQVVGGAPCFRYRGAD